MWEVSNALNKNKIKQESTYFKRETQRDREREVTQGQTTYCPLAV